MTLCVSSNSRPPSKTACKSMWQRKQTLFLLLAVVLGVVTLSVRFYSWLSFVLLLFASALDLYTIFIYKHRMRQAACCLVSVFACLAWYIALIVYSKQTAPDASQFQLVWSDVLPMVCAILTFMARKAIIADEKLVRAADRIR